MLLNNGACDNDQSSFKIDTLQVWSETLGLVYSHPHVQLYEGKSTGVLQRSWNSRITSIAPPNIIQDPIQTLANAQQLSAISELNCPIRLRVLRHSKQLAPM